MVPPRQTLPALQQLLPTRLLATLLHPKSSSSSRARRASSQARRVTRLQLQVVVQVSPVQASHQQHHRHQQRMPAKQPRASQHVWWGQLGRQGQQLPLLQLQQHCLTQSKRTQLLLVL